MRMMPPGTWTQVQVLDRSRYSHAFPQLGGWRHHPGGSILCGCFLALAALRHSWGRMGACHQPEVATWVWPTDPGCRGCTCRHETLFGRGSAATEVDVLRFDTSRALHMASPVRGDSLHPGAPCVPLKPVRLWSGYEGSANNGRGCPRSAKSRRVATAGTATRHALRHGLPRGCRAARDPGGGEEGKVKVQKTGLSNLHAMRAAGKGGGGGSGRRQGAGTSPSGNCAGRVPLSPPIPRQRLHCSCSQRAPRFAALQLWPLPQVLQGAGRR